MDRRALHRRLQRARTLADRGSTAGEREAARAAVERIQQRIGAIDPVSPDDVALDRTLQPASENVVPTQPELVRVVRDWMQEQRSAADISAEAAALIDRAVLPDCTADDPVSIRVEVVMLLSTLETGLLTPADGPALLSFLECQPDDCVRGWERWFHHLETRTSAASAQLSESR